MNEFSNKRAISMILVAIILVIGAIASSTILINGVVKVKTNQSTIMVTGSAKQQITSDKIVWTGSFSTKSKDLTDAYGLLEENRNKVLAYLMKQGLAEDEIVFSSIHTSYSYVMTEYGSYTNEIDYYELYQTVTVDSDEVDKITDISRSATELINEGVAFVSDPPQYFYTKLADMKIEMLAAATKDARRRAEEMVKSAGSELGDLTYADMGVMQITPRYSNAIDDYGINDTSSLEKEITAVVHCKFEIAD